MSMNSSTEGLIRWHSPAQEEEQSVPNVWRQMSYVPPRGPCGYKSSLITSPCACLRFMIHPSNASTSFDCDGCGHHASYHQMRNKADEEVTSRWTREDGSFDKQAYEMDEEVQEVLARRKRLGIPGGVSSNSDLLMPSKARSTLVGQPNGRKRMRSEKQMI